MGKLHEVSEGGGGMTRYWNSLTDEGKSAVCITFLVVEWFLLFGIIV